MVLKYIIGHVGILVETVLFGPLLKCLTDSPTKFLKSVIPWSQTNITRCIISSLFGLNRRNSKYISFKP